MVKNVNGGNKHKGQARKFATAKPSNKLRISLDEGEIYAIVTKMLGNGMFDAHCIDNISRLGHIRGKFSGRRKRDNMVEIGKWVLVGEREWDIQSTEDKNKKQQKLKCDLLEVYNDFDKERLIDTIAVDWSILITQDITKTKESYDKSEEIAFITEREEECERIIKEIGDSRTISMNINTSVNDEDWIDDI